MSDQRRESAVPVEPYFDRTPQPFGDGPPDPLVYDASPRMLRQRTAAKRLVDMRYVPCCGVKGGILFTAAVETLRIIAAHPRHQSRFREGGPRVRNPWSQEAVAEALGRVRTRLAAGGGRIRTPGPPVETAFSRPPRNPATTSRPGRPNRVLTIDKGRFTVRPARLARQ